MKYIELKDINEYKSESINPAKMQETIFELYSVPVYETGHPEYLTGKEIASSKIVVRKNDILLCKINPRINRVWIVRKESENINIASSEWIVVRNNKYNPEFLAWYFRSPKFRQLMVSEVTGIGGSLTRAQPKRVAKYPVPIMDRIIQDKIVYRLNRIQKIIDMKKKELIKLDLLIQSRFVEMFGTLDNPTQNFQTARLEELCSKITDGKHGGCVQEKGTKRYFVGAREIYDDKIHYDTAPEINIIEFEKDYKRCNVEKGDFLIVNTGATIGKSAIATDERTTHTLLQKSVALLKVRKELLNSVFLKWCYRVNTKMYMVESASAQANLLLSKIRATKIYVPDINLQNQFATFVKQVNKSKFVIHKFLYCTTHNTKSIIKPRLNTKESGKIRGGKPHADEF